MMYLYRYPPYSPTALSLMKAVVAMPSFPSITGRTFILSSLVAVGVAVGFVTGNLRLHA